MNIHDQRIHFRRPEATDLPALYVQKNDPEIKRLLGGVSYPLSRRDLDDWLERHRKSTDEVLWVIEGSADGKCLGHVGLYKVDPIRRCAEIGIMIGDKNAWGKGIGRVATTYAIRYGFRELNLHRISLTVLASNLRAVALYKKLGFIQEGIFRQAHFRDGEYIDVIAMGLLRSEYHDAD